MKLPAEIVARLKEIYEGRTVCVTGGAGFIGGHLADALVSLGSAVVVIDDLSNSTTAHLSGLIELDPQRVRFVHGSILEDAALAEALGTGRSAARTVFHLAAMGSVPRSLADPERAWAVNATGTIRVLEAARRAGVDRVVYAASSSAYGDSPGLPKLETMPAAPASPYAASKLAGEHLAAVWSRCYGLQTVSLRYFNVFGPRQPADSAYAAVVAAFAARLLAGRPPVIFGDGSQTRDFTFVGNAVLATLLAGAAPGRFTGEVINVGAGGRTSVRELARLIGAAVAGAGPIPDPVFEPARGGDVAHSQADISAARRLLGYEVVTTLEAGVAETVEWYRDSQPAVNSAR